MTLRRLLLLVPLLAVAGWVLSPYSIVVLRVENLTGGPWNGAVSVHGEQRQLALPDGAAARVAFFSTGGDSYSSVSTAGTTAPCAYHGRPSSSVTVQLQAAPASITQVRCKQRLWLFGAL